MNELSIDEPDLTLLMLFSRWPATVSAFQSHRMLCFGCPIVPFHTITDACEEYGLDEVVFRAELRAAAIE
jgi:hybrid cluster-associated redox disulfide protein